MRDLLRLYSLRKVTVVNPHSTPSLLLGFAVERE